MLEVENDQLLLSYETRIHLLNAQLKEESDDHMQLELDL